MQNVPTLYGPVTRSQYDRAAQIRLPMCVQNRHDYLADIYIGGKVFQAAFTAQ